MIVDDHPLVRSGLRQLFESEIDFSVCCEAANIAQALTLITEYSPDFAIIDLSLPDGSGLDLIKRLLIKHPHLPILVSSMHDEDLFADRALSAGAKGYINKQEAGEELITAARKVLGGNIYLSHRMSERYKSQPATDIYNLNGSLRKHLSNRELEVFELIGHGITTRVIAETLHLSIKTIESHRSNIKSKLGLHSAGELTRSAVRWTLEE